MASRIRVLTRRDTFVSLVLAILLLLASFALTDVWGAGEEGSDVALYAGYGEAVMQGSFPYRDLRVEYPPGTLAVIVPPAALSDDPFAYGDIFVLLAGALFAATVAATWLSLVELGHRRAGLLGRLLPVACAPLLLGPVAVQRLDPLPALLVSVALLLAVLDRLAFSSFVTGLATATKLYPAVLLPALLTRSRRIGGARAAARALVWFAVGVVLVVLPFVLFGGSDGLVHVLRYHADRPLQIETAGASAALFLHVVSGFDVGLATGYGSVNLGGARGQVIGAAQTVVFLVTLAWLVVRTTRIATTLTGLLLASAALITSLLALGKVLSPQYLVWLLPVIPLVRGRLGLIATAWLAATCVVTQVWYEHYYVPVTKGLDSVGIVVLVTRNGMLVLLLVLLVVGVEREARRRADDVRSRRPLAGE